MHHKLILPFMAALLFGCSESASVVDSGSTDRSTAPPTDAAADGVRADAGNLGPAEVEILRDEYGVPHIYGGSAEAAMYGLGWAQAEDHLPLMSVFYLEATGQLAQTFSGDIAITPATESADQLLRIDRTVRLFRFLTDPEEQWSQIDDEDDPGWPFSTRTLQEAFSAGINDYVEANRAALPSWIPIYSPQGALSLAQYLMRARQIQLLMQKAPALAQDLGLLPSEIGEWGGSNMFAVGPGRNDNGSVRVLASPHLAYHGHSLWYEAHIVGGPFNVAGAMLYGMPAVVMAHNEQIAFSLTNNSADNADLFSLPVDPGDGTRYLVDGQPRSFELAGETVTLAGGGEHTFKRAFAKLGEFVCPVVDPVEVQNFQGRAAVTVACATSIGDPFAMTQLWKMNLARDVAGFKEALTGLHIPRWNMVAGDRQGHIFYVCNSRHPRRGAATWNTVVDGGNSANHWQGLLDFSELPQAEDPATGFVQNCNNSPGWTTHVFGDPIDMTEYPADLCSHGTSAGLRPRRMLDLLEGSTSHTFEGLEAVAMDRYILLAEAYVPLLNQWEQSVGDQVADRAAVQRGLAVLAPWDLTASVDSRGAALFTRWALKVKSWKSLPYPAPPVVTPADQVGALSLLAEAVVALETNQGRADVLYGDVHRIRRGTVNLPVGGSEGGLQALFLNTTEGEGGVGYAWSGASYHMLTELGPDGVRAVSVKPWGQSDDPASPHYADLTEVFAQARHKPFWFERAEIEAHQTARQILRYLR